MHNLTDEQKRFILSSANTYRFCYNWGLAYCNRLHEEGQKKCPTFFEMCTAFTGYKQNPENKWLYAYDSTMCRYALKNVRRAFDNFFEGRSRYPKFHSKKKSKVVFHTRGDTLIFHKGGRYVHIPGSGRSPSMWFDCKNHNIPIGPNIKYDNVAVTYDGIDFWLSVSISLYAPIEYEGYTEPIGIDVGIRTTATLSNGITFDRPDKYRLGILENRKRKVQKSISRYRDRIAKEAKRMKTKCEEIPKSKNQLKREALYRKTCRDIHYIYNNHFHQISRKIAKMRPSVVVIEDLRIDNMRQKSKHEARNFANVQLGAFLTMIEYKCKELGADVRKAHRFFPSSQICSRCGTKRKIGKGKQYYCFNCGLSIDRDLNAAINLRNVGLRSSAPI